MGRLDRNQRNPDVVSASEIAAWAWCPESWRLHTLGMKPENQADLRRGETHHARKAWFEAWSRSAMSLGWWLLLGAALLAALALLQVRA